jgi:hypothetical protein
MAKPGQGSCISKAVQTASTRSWLWELLADGSLPRSRRRSGVVWLGDSARLPSSGGAPGAGQGRPKWPYMEKARHCWGPTPFIRTKKKRCACGANPRAPVPASQGAYSDLPPTRPLPPEMPPPPPADFELPECGRAASEWARRESRSACTAGSSSADERCANDDRSVCEGRDVWGERTTLGWRHGRPQRSADD